MKTSCLTILLMIACVACASDRVTDLYEVGQGSVAMTGHSTYIQNQYIYSPYGYQKNLAHPVGLNRNVDDSAQALINGSRKPLSLEHNHFGYTGQSNDPSTGLMMLGGFRNYAPGIGRFIQPDTYNSFSNVSINNAFAYVDNNPLVAIDPTGHMLVSSLVFININSFESNFGLRTLLMVAATTVVPEDTVLEAISTNVDREVAVGSVPLSWRYDPYSATGWGYTGESSSYSVGLQIGAVRSNMDSATQAESVVIDRGEQAGGLVEQNDAGVGDSNVRTQERFSQTAPKPRPRNQQTMTQRLMIDAQTQGEITTTERGTQAESPATIKTMDGSSQADAMPLESLEYNSLRTNLLRVQGDLRDKDRIEYIRHFNTLSTEQKTEVRPLFRAAERHREKIEIWAQDQTPSKTDGETLLSEGNRLLQSFPRPPRAWYQLW